MDRTEIERMLRETLEDERMSRGEKQALSSVLEEMNAGRSDLNVVRHLVFDLAREHLRCICGDAFEDPRTELVIADGARYVAETDARYDVIMIDSTDPIGPAEVLFGEPFYASCKRCLAPGGVVVTQNGVPWVQEEELRLSIDRLRRHFGDVSAYLAAQGVKHQGFWSTHCPRCNSKELNRIHRLTGDRLLGSLGFPVRRYRCRNCAWKGLRIYQR